MQTSKYTLGAYEFEAVSDMTLPEYQGEVSTDVLRVLIAVMERRCINVDFTDVISYKVLYDLLVLMRALGIPTSHINWQIKPSARFLHREYMYAVSLILRQLADFDEYINGFQDDVPIVPLANIMVTNVHSCGQSVSHDSDRHEMPPPSGLETYMAAPSSNPWDFLPEAKNLLQIDDWTYVESLSFYAAYNVDYAFTTGDEATRALIKQYNIMRDVYSEHMLICPYDLKNYFTYTPDTREVWKCTALNMNTLKLQYGESTLAPEDVALERLEKFSCGYVTRDTRLRNCIFAGGMPTRVLNADYNVATARKSDGDAFVLGPDNEAKYDAFKQVASHFETPGTFYAVRGSLVNTYILDVPRKFQLISGNHTNAWQVLTKFDTTHIQWMFADGKFYGTPAACRSLRYKIAEPAAIHKVQADRMIKTLCLGYDIAYTPELITKCDIGDLIHDKNNLRVRNILKDMHKYYYPRSEADVPLDEQMPHLKAMIGEDSKCSNIVMTAEECANAVQIGGSFENGYDMMAYATFDVTSIENKFVGTKRTVLYRRSGAISLISDRCEVLDVSAGDNVIITLRINDQFQEFLTRVLDGIVYAQFVRASPTRKLCAGDGTTVIVIKAFKYEMQGRVGFSIMKNQRGDPLDIKDDLRAGDEIQFMFKVVVMNTLAERCMELDITKILKHDTTPVEPMHVSDYTPSAAPAPIVYEEF